MADRLKGKVCVITGTGGSMGSAAALLFAREGAAVVGCDVNPNGSAATLDLVRREEGRMVALHPCDLTDAKQCHVLTELALDTYGRIDVLYNNAAMAYFGWIDQISNENWYHTINEEVNLVFLLTKAVWPHLAKQGGSIVNTASVSARLGYRVLPGVAHASAKGAIVSMTRHLAMEGRNLGIRANSISPGVIETLQTQPLLKDPVWAEAMVGKAMLNRLGRPEEVVQGALFLASDESSYITGHDLVIDGGASCW